MLDKLFKLEFIIFCPKCRSEYVEGITKCPDCQVKLLCQLQEESAIEFMEFTTILKTSNTSIITVAKSILEEAKIEFFIINERLQDFMGEKWQDSTPFWVVLKLK